ncbi:MAG: DUF2852 domain-containing protein [Rhodospirillales bacterium]|nr:DUF2852 domain-containing protein [Rhodospirillales bacterium]
MSGYAAYGPASTPNASPWSQQPPPGWVPYGWHDRAPNRLLAIALTLLAFMIWWPVGLVVLAFTFGRRCMRRSFFRESRQHWGEHGMSWKFGGWQGSCGPASNSSGNRAFDDYRAETLRRLEEEQKEFAAFLDRLRVAKDKAEFDAFMAERRRAAEPPPGAHTA